MNINTRSKPATITDLVQRWVNTNVETVDVAVVVGNSFYESSRLVDVQPLAYVRDRDGTEVEVPKVLNCPVILQGNVEGFISFPMNIGTKVLIGYPKHSLEEFVYSDTSNSYTPVDGLTFGSAQAVVVGYLAQANAVDFPLSNSNFEIRFKDSRLTFDPTGKITLNNSSFILEADPDGTLGVSNGVVTLLLNSSGSWSVNGSLAGNLNGATVTSDGNFITSSGTDLNQLKEDFDKLHEAYIAHGIGAANHPPPDPL